MSEFEIKLAELRQEVDMVDDAICELLSTRMVLSEEIGYLKKEHGVDEMSTSRREEIYSRLDQVAIELGISTIMVRSIYSHIFDHSIIRQTTILNKK